MINAKVTPKSAIYIGQDMTGLEPFEDYAEIQYWQENASFCKFSVRVYSGYGIDEEWPHGFEGGLEPATREESHKLLDGAIGFDGCANFTFGDKGFIHFCEAAEFDRLARLLRRCRQIASEKIEGWCGD